MSCPHQPARHRRRAQPNRHCHIAPSASTSPTARLAQPRPARARAPSLAAAKAVPPRSDLDREGAGALLFPAAPASPPACGRRRSRRSLPPQVINAAARPSIPLCSFSSLALSLPLLPQGTKSIIWSFRYRRRSSMGTPTPDPATMASSPPDPRDPVLPASSRCRSLQAAAARPRREEDDAIYVAGLVHAGRLSPHESRPISTLARREEQLRGSNA